MRIGQVNDRDFTGNPSNGYIEMEGAHVIKIRDSIQFDAPLADTGTRLGTRVLNKRLLKQGYSTRLVHDTAAVKSAQALRFSVFNLELGEGLATAWATGRDEDEFDSVCDHLLVEYEGEVVGTYRLQPGRRAGHRLGYYSEQEFDFSPFASRRDEIVELGRACVSREHRNLVVLGLLWRGIASYAREHGARYLIGCSSLTSQNEREGAALYAAFSRQFAAPEIWRTKPHAHYQCCLDAADTPPPRVPRLLSAYLSLGARICAPPAIDREFQTIDFLTLLDIETLPEQARALLA